MARANQKVGYSWSTLKQEYIRSNKSKYVEKYLHNLPLIANPVSFPEQFLLKFSLSNLFDAKKGMHIFSVNSGKLFWEFFNNGLFRGKREITIILFQGMFME